tara:strand:- start:384 stop:554 length:171 start_codon:yes stop_codon:yes gene_type:complete
MTDKKSHAAEQRAHYERKMSTHQRVCVWVPRDHVEEVKATLDRKLKKIAKLGGRET